MTQNVRFVYSTSSRNQASVVMRTFQLCDMMKDRYSDEFDFDTTYDLNNTHDSILIYSKHAIRLLTPRACEILKKRNNKIILDYICEPPKTTLKDYVDVYCASSRSQETWFQQQNLPTHFVCHHADPRVVERFKGGSVSPEVKYIGNLQNTIIPKGLKIRTVTSNTSTQSNLDWMKELENPFIYYMIRKWMKFDGFKPFTKGVLAAQIDSLVIGQKDTADNNYYLKDYPYMTSKKPTDKEIIEVVNRTIESVKSKDSDYDLAVSIMNQIKHDSSYDVITQQVYNMITSL